MQLCYSFKFYQVVGKRDEQIHNCKELGVLRGLFSLIDGDNVV